MVPTACLARSHRLVFASSSSCETVAVLREHERLQVEHDNGTSYRMTLHNGVLTYVKDSDKPARLTLTVPAPALTALATGNLDAARSSGLTTDGDESQLATLFSVLQSGDPGFNIVEP